MFCPSEQQAGASPLLALSSGWGTNTGAGCGDLPSPFPTGLMAVPLEILLISAIGYTSNGTNFSINPTNYDVGHERCLFPPLSEVRASPYLTGFMQPHFAAPGICLLFSAAYLFSVLLFITFDRKEPFHSVSVALHCLSSKIILNLCNFLGLAESPGVGCTPFTSLVTPLKPARKLVSSCGCCKRV